MSSVKVWSIEFIGHYPVGAVAVVFADSAVQAAILLYNSDEFKLHRPFNNLDTMAKEAKRLMSKQPVNILLDGNY